MTPFRRDDVLARFDAYPPTARRRMLALRELVLKTAAQTPGVGAVEETWKWGEPAYVTPNKAGSTVRIEWKPRAPEQVAVYFNCQTTLVATFRQLFPHDFRFEGNRALVLDLAQRLPLDSLAFCIAASFTYHLNKASR
ncbi:DUF1801 domain-containing protein [Roseateles sp. NT4]|uniref:DUF1801 domain-containing protein n=1 Tax=Roseateles sp. NT4 TaxID=3453715 RepID=UPI003EED8B38